jgi:multidrug resistance efflux pump
VANSQPDQAGLASVNPIFTWVRLAQRVPVGIHIDQVPDGVRLIQGMTATVEVQHDNSTVHRDAAYHEHSVSTKKLSLDALNK